MVWWKNNERHCNGGIHGGAMTRASWSDAAYGDQSSLGKCRLGYVFGLMSSNLCAPCHLIQWTSKFARKLVKGSLGGEVYALGKMLDHMSMIREFYGRFTDLHPGMAGVENCDSLPTHLKENILITEKFLVRHFLATQQAIELQELDYVYWAPGRENPAGGLPELHSGILPLLRLMEAGTYNPGRLRPLKGLAFWGRQFFFYPSLRAVYISLRHVFTFSGSVVWRQSPCCL